MVDTSSAWLAGQTQRAVWTRTPVISSSELLSSEPRAARANSEVRRFLVDSGGPSCYFQTSVCGAQLEMSKRLSTTGGFTVWLLREKYPFSLPNADLAALAALTLQPSPAH